MRCLSARLIVFLAVLSLLASACRTNGDGDAAQDEQTVAENGETAQSEGDPMAGTATSKSEEPSDDTGDDPTSEADAGVDGITIGLGALPEELDPYVNATPPRSYILYSLYSTLTRVEDGADGPEVTPGLAESWQATDDTTWEFSLRPDVAFPNGEPVNADAVVFSAEFVLDPDNSRALGNQLGSIETINAVDDVTVSFTTAQPEPLLPTLLGALAIIPPGAFEEAGGEAFFEDPIGTGPFVVEEWSPGERLVMVANDAALDGPPATAWVEMALIAEDAARVAALQSGDVDIINKVPVDSLDPLEAAGFLLTSTVEPATYLVDLYAEEGPLNDVRIRQAINYAVDKEALLEGIYAGNGAVADGQIAPPSVGGHCPDVEAYPYDPERATELVAEAGNPDVSVTLQASSGFIINDTLLAQAVAEQISALGFDVEVEISEIGTFFDAFADPSIRGDLYAWRLTSSPQMNAIVSYQFFLSEGSFHDIGWDNAEFDAAFETASVSSVDSDEREAAMCSMATVMFEEAPVLFGLNTPDLWMTADDISDFVVGTDTNPDLSTVSR